MLSPNHKSSKPESPDLFPSITLSPFPSPSFPESMWQNNYWMISQYTLNNILLEFVISTLRLYTEKSFNNCILSVDLIFPAHLWLSARPNIVWLIDGFNVTRKRLALGEYRQLTKYFTSGRMEMKATVGILSWNILAFARRDYNLKTRLDDDALGRRVATFLRHPYYFGIVCLIIGFGASYTMRKLQTCVEPYWLFDFQEIVFSRKYGLKFPFISTIR